MKEIISRLKADVPLFFKRVRAAAVSLSAAGASILLIPNIPETLSHYAGQAVWVGAVAAVIAQMTCQNPDDIKK